MSERNEALVLGIGAYRAGALELGTPDGSAVPLLGASNIKSIGALLYSKYLFLFESAGIILLVAMIGAIVLTHRTRRDNRGSQNIARQVARRHAAEQSAKEILATPQFSDAAHAERIKGYRDRKSVV